MSCLPWQLFPRYKAVTMELLLVLSLLAIGIHVDGQMLETKKASQCFKSRGIPKVSFSCPPDSMIKITKAFHGIAVTERSLLDKDECTPSPGMDNTNCTFCKGDCVDDSMNLVYDWSTCMGNTSCVRTVMQSFMPDCAGRDKFSDYLQVEYQCIPKSSVIDICSNLDKQWLTGGGYLMSPNYPYHYPVNQDCMCTLQTDVTAKILLSFYDLLLETKKGRCRADWLMLRQGEEKHRHCGAIMTGVKNITSTGNMLRLQFHSDANNNVTQTFQYFSRVLKGFWLYFTPTSPATIQISCRVLTPHDDVVKEIIIDDSDDFSKLITKDNKDMERPQNPMPPNDNELPMKDQPGADMNMDKMGKMADRKMENEVMDKEPEVGKENKVNHLESSKGQTSGGTSATAKMSVLILVLFFEFIH